MSVTSNHSITDTVEWLNDNCPGGDSVEWVLSQLCDRLTALGAPLAYGGVFVRTLHPEIMGRRFVWRRGGGVEMTTVGYNLFDDVEYRDSPVAWVFAHGRRVRLKLYDPNSPQDFTFLDRFRDQGATDLLVLPLRFSNGDVHVVAWATDRPTGFTDAQIDLLQTFERPIARMAEVRTLKRTAISLLDTYVGGQAGGRILSGGIRRGNVEAIRAAIWLSDMRGFTARADRMPATDLVELLNRYFDCQVPAIRDHGGEVLKFMGDGLLAIFPIDGEVADAVCSQALAAARLVESNVAAADWGGLEQPGALHFGVALHIGEVLYGNVGSANRLDFTCIGPAVNIAARIEKLSGEIGRTILASQDFAQLCEAAMRDRMLVPLGAFSLKGVSAPQHVYGIG